MLRFIPEAEWISEYSFLTKPFSALSQVFPLITSTMKPHHPKMCEYHSLAIIKLSDQIDTQPGHLHFFNSSHQLEYLDKDCVSQNYVTLSDNGEGSVWTGVGDYGFLGVCSFQGIFYSTGTCHNLQNLSPPSDCKVEKCMNLLYKCVCFCGFGVQVLQVHLKHVQA